MFESRDRVLKAMRRWIRARAAALGAAAGGWASETAFIGATLIPQKHTLPQGAGSLSEYSPWPRPRQGPALDGQVPQHPLQREMPVALSREHRDFTGITVLGGVQGDPSVVSHVRRNSKARIESHQLLTFDADPEAQAEASVVAPGPGKSLLAGLPDGKSELARFLGFGKLQALRAHYFQ